MRWILKNDSSPRRFEKLPADTMLFWYRGSPRPMAPTAFDVFDQPALRVTRDDPADAGAGNDLRLPERRRAARAAHGRSAAARGRRRAGARADWGLLFSEAGIDFSRYTPVEPRWPPLTYADARAAWEGPHPDRPEIRARIEAAAYRGRPVSFFVVAPWDYPALQAPYSPTTGEIAGLWAFYTLFLAVFVAAVVLARRNLRLERGDRAGAVRLCVAAIVLSLASWAIGSAHTATEDELRMFLNAVGAALFNAFLVGTFYLALEPFIRRRFPRALVSWSRLLSGRWRDWMVGRDVLLGMAGAVSTQVVWCLAWRLADRFGAAIPTYQQLLERDAHQRPVGGELDSRADSLGADHCLPLLLPFRRRAGARAPGLDCRRGHGARDRTADRRVR